MATILDKTVEFEGVEVIRSTEKALLCVIDGEEYWMPKSKITDDSEVYAENTSGKLVVEKWIALEKGLIDADE